MESTALFCGVFDVEMNRPQCIARCAAVSIDGTWRREKGTPLRGGALTLADEHQSCCRDAVEEFDDPCGEVVACDEPASCE